jgi:hypothetical protein
MKDLLYTETEIDKFLQNADFDIINDLHSNQMIEENISFDQFLKMYNKKYSKKHHKKLKTN